MLYEVITDGHVGEALPGSADQDFDVAPPVRVRRIVNPDPGAVVPVITSYSIHYTKLYDGSIRPG